MKSLAFFFFAVTLMMMQCVLLFAEPTGTAFTYQGRLLDNNVTADGLYDMQFKLYDDPNVLTANQIGLTFDANDVDVVDGYFIAELDFGNSAFDGNARWLEIAVRPYESTNPDDYVALKPLQPITPAPYAQSASEVTGRVRTANIHEGGSYDTWLVKNNLAGMYAVAMSVDGSIQTAVDPGGHIYVSTDTGDTWTAKESNRIWRSVAMSADGSIQTAVVENGQIYVSTDTGNTWTAKDSNRYWWSVAMSADGSRQTAVGGDGIYVSTDTGQTWTQRNSSAGWVAIAVSDIGYRQTAVKYGGQIYVSTDTGNTWTPKESNRDWWSVAMSASGAVQIAGVAGLTGGQLYVSTDYGNTWTPKESDRHWRCVAMSADGSVMAAGDFYGNGTTGGAVYLSTDTGNTWSPKIPNGSWNGVAMSDDGNIVTAVDSNAWLYLCLNNAVGIGTTTPTQRLEVDGTVKATAFIGDGSKLTGTFNAPLSITESSDEPLLRLENTGWGWGLYSLAHGPWSAVYGYHYDGGNMASIATPDAGIVATSSSDYAGIFNGKTKVSGNFTVEDSGNVGISTPSPAIDLAIGDTDTGLQQQGDGQLAVYTNNVERVRIDSAGKVGIGTPSPSEKLEVNGTVKATAFSGDGSGLTGIAYSESDPQVGTNSADYVPRWDGSTLTSGSLLDDGNRVGIGSLVGQLSKFQVQNDSLNRGISCITDFSVNTPPYGQAILAIEASARGNTTWPSYAVHGQSSNSIGPSYGIRGDATSNNTGTNYGVYGKAYNNGSGDAWAGYFFGRAYFDKEVGIGTENPSSQLDIKSSSSAFISLERGANELGGINWKETSVSGTQWIFPFFRGWQSDNLIVRDEATLLDVMTFEAGTGQVGIGTSSPTHLLHVNGVARSTQSTWATSSDERVKQNITELTNGVQTLTKLRPVSFTYTEEYVTGNNAPADEQFGFVAQEVKEVIPEMVTYTSENVGDTTIEDFHLLNSGKLIPILVQAVKEQQKQIQFLQAEIENLKNDIKK